MIVAHLDLDAFFAAVEELEQPELRWRPLVVGGDPHGRGVVATANYVARQFGIHSAMSSAEALRRCPDAIFVRPRHRALLAYSRGVWAASARCARPSSIPASTRATSTSAQVAGDSVAPAKSPRPFRRPSGPRRASRRLSVSPRCKVVAKVASDRRKPGGLTVVPPGREACLPRAVRRPPPARCRPPRRGQARAAGVATIGRARRPRRRRAVAAPSRQDRSCCSATAPAASTLGRSRPRSKSCPSPPRRPSTATSPTAGSLHDELRRMSARSRPPREGGLSARTVTTKVRYPDFAIRSRSQTLPVGTDDPDRIGRARVRAARPGARGPPGRAQARRRRRLQPRGLQAVDALVTTGAHRQSQIDAPRRSFRTGLGTPLKAKPAMPKVTIRQPEPRRSRTAVASTAASGDRSLAIA